MQKPHYSENQKLLPESRAIAADAGCSPAQLALAWVLQHGDNMHVIPETTSEVHLEEDFGALDVELPKDIVECVATLINQQTGMDLMYRPSWFRRLDENHVCAQNFAIDKGETVYISDGYNPSSMVPFTTKFKKALLIKWLTGLFGSRTWNRLESVHSPEIIVLPDFNLSD